MFFLNLTAGQFFALFGGLGGLVTALYLLDRAKRKKVVSTLRFWTSAITAEEKTTRRRMRDPWSLFLQLVSLLLLLLAIAQLQWGTRERKERNRVLLLDTSAWSAALENPADPSHRVIDREKQLARDYIAALPNRDRVMIVLADALATPVTPFTADRTRLNMALRDAAPGFSALNVQQALAYAQEAQTWSGGEPGEIVYIGPKQASSSETALRGISNLRVISVRSNPENAGIVHMAVKRTEDTANEWQATITVKNYSLRRRILRVRTRFGTTSFAPRILNLAPQQEAVAEYAFVTTTGGDLVSELDPPDALASDNKVTLSLPRNGLLRVAVFTARPEILRPLLEANQRLSAKFFAPTDYQANPPADVMVLDQMSPSKPPAIPALWIEPLREASPLPVKTVVENAVITNWNSTIALGAGLHAKEAHLTSAEVFESFEGDLAIGSVTSGPVVVARPAASGRPKIALIGFDPLAGEMKFEVTTPLLFANLFHWLSQESLRTIDLSAGRVGAATLPLEPSEHADTIRVTAQNGDAVPFTIHDGSLQLFTARPNIIRITSSSRERVLSLTLPDVAEHVWTPPATSMNGLPAAANWSANSITLWQWLAVLGAIGLLSEWLLFGRRRIGKRKRVAPADSAGKLAGRMREERQLVSQ